MKNIKLFIFTLFLTFVFFTNTLSQWIENGIPVRNTWDSEYVDMIIPDDEGNVYVIWESMNTLFSLYVTKIDTGGYRMWDTDSTLISLYPSQQRSFDAVADGEGGLVIAWQDSRDYPPDVGDIYVQRIDKKGNRLWGENGKIVIQEEHKQDDVKICRLGENYIITFVDERVGYMRYQIYSQMISKNGDMLWDSSGVAISDMRGENYFFNVSQKIFSSDEKSCIIVWEFDDWNNDYNNLYAQKLDKYGNMLWDSSGVAITNLPYDQGMWGDFDICNDGAGGVVIIWTDERISWKNELYIQRLDSSGKCVWQENGIKQPNSFNHPTIINPGDGTYMYFWCRATLFAQKISPDGEYLFPDNGLQIGDDFVTKTAQQQKAILSSDSSIILVWKKTWGVEQHSDIYTQQIDFYGNKLLGEKDLPVVMAPDVQEHYQISSDLHGGVYIAWKDLRDWTTNDADIYLQRIYSDGRGSVNEIIDENIIIPGETVLYQNYPNPFNIKTVISYRLSVLSQVELVLYNVLGQKVRTLVNKKQHPGLYSFQLNTNGLASGLYVYLLKTEHKTLSRKMLFVK